jgi:hypothetical protein
MIGVISALSGRSDYNRDVTTGYLNPITTKGGRFCPPSQSSQLTFSRGYVSVIYIVSFNKIDPYSSFLILHDNFALLNCVKLSVTKWRNPIEEKDANFVQKLI